MSATEKISNKRETCKNYFKFSALKLIRQPRRDSNKAPFDSPVRTTLKIRNHSVKANSRVQKLGVKMSQIPSPQRTPLKSLTRKSATVQYPGTNRETSTSGEKDRIRTLELQVHRLKYPKFLSQNLAKELQNSKKNPAR